MPQMHAQQLPHGWFMVLQCKIPHEIIKKMQYDAIDFNGYSWDKLLPAKSGMPRQNLLH